MLTLYTIDPEGTVFAHQAQGVEQQGSQTIIYNFYSTDYDVIRNNYPLQHLAKSNTSDEIIKNTRMLQESLSDVRFRAKTAFDLNPTCASKTLKNGYLVTTYLNSKTLDYEDANVQIVPHTDINLKPIFYNKNQEFCYNKDIRSYELNQQIGKDIVNNWKFFLDQFSKKTTYKQSIKNDPAQNIAFACTFWGMIGLGEFCKTNNIPAIYNSFRKEGHSLFNRAIHLDGISTTPQRGLIPHPCVGISKTEGAKGVTSVANLANVGSYLNDSPYVVAPTVLQKIVDIKNNEIQEHKEGFYKKNPHIAVRRDVSPLWIPASSSDAFLEFEKTAPQLLAKKRIPTTKGVPTKLLKRIFVG